MISIKKMLTFIINFPIGIIRSIIIKYETRKFNKKLSMVKRKYIDKIGYSYAVNRFYWMKKPNLPKEDYFYNPTYGSKGLLWRYEESDKSLKRRIKEQYEIRRSNKKM